MTTLFILLLCVAGLAAGAWIATSEANQIEASRRPEPKQVEPPKPKSTLPPPPKVPRTVTWYRKHSRGNLEKLMAQSYTESDEKPTIELNHEDMGFEVVRAPALYDNGVYIVVDSVKDVLFDVLHQVHDPTVDAVFSHKRWRLVRQIPLDFDEAVRFADDLKIADEKNPEL